MGEREEVPVGVGKVAYGVGGLLVFVLRKKYKNPVFLEQEQRQAQMTGQPGDRVLETGAGSREETAAPWPIPAAGTGVDAGVSGPAWKKDGWQGEAWVSSQGWDPAPRRPDGPWSAHHPLTGKRRHPSKQPRPLSQGLEAGFWFLCVGRGPGRKDC